MLAGLKLPEDEIVEIRCKQQDRTVAERKDIDFDGEYVYTFTRFFLEKKLFFFRNAAAHSLGGVGRDIRVLLFCFCATIYFKNVTVLIHSAMP